MTNFGIFSCFRWRISIMAEKSEYLRGGSTDELAFASAPVLTSNTWSQNAPWPRHSQASQDEEGSSNEVKGRTGYQIDPGGGCDDGSGSKSMPAKFNVMPMKFNAVQAARRSPFASSLRSTPFPVGGYRVPFIKPVQEKHRCGICSLPLREPVQTRCGHLYCSSCVTTRPG